MEMRNLIFNYPDWTLIIWTGEDYKIQLPK